MKKVVALVMALVLCLSCVSVLAENTADLSKVKLGVILLHDEDSVYDMNFIKAVETAKTTLGLSDDQVIVMRNIPESNECYEAALDLVDEGCNIVFADSFSHESFLMQAAQECPDVEFCHATGTSAHTAGIANFHNAFAAIYEGRYLAGVAAGMKLNEIKAAGQLKGEVPMMGYVGAYTYAEIISGYSAFYLGAKSVCEDVIMKVQFTGNWLDEKEEKATAEALIAMGCDLISQHADSMGAPTACENAGIPDVAYNLDTMAACPNTYIISSSIDWSAYFMYIVNQVANGEEIATDYVGNLSNGAVKLTVLNENVAAAGTAEKLAELQAKIEAGELNVFDVSTFTVNNGQTLESALMDGSIELVTDGYFHESVYRSAPAFDFEIDGIEKLNQMY